MGGHFDIEHYREALVILAIAGVVIPVVHRLHLSPVLGFIVAGLLVGPHGLGALAAEYPWLRPFAITSTADVAVIAETGVVFLLFVIGLELSFERLWTMRRLVFAVGGAQVLVTAAVMAASLAAFGLSAGVALVLGSCLALSSTAIILEVLSKSGRLTTTTGRTGFSILLFQDLAVVPILFLVAVFGASRGGPALTDFGSALGQAVVAIAAILVIGRTLLRPLFRLVARTRSRELFMAATLLVVLGTAVATASAGVSMALGAFLAGLVMAETEFRREIEIDMEPFKGLLLGVFFIAVGMSLDLKILAAAPGAVAVGLVALLVTKAVVLFLILLAFSVRRAVAAELALLLAGGGEFAFVALGIARGNGVMEPHIADLALLVTSGSMLITPLLASLGRNVGGWIRHGEATETMAPSQVDNDATTLVIGFGRVGRLVGQMLTEAGLPYVAVDHDADLVAAARREGTAVSYGDASRPEFLRRAGLASARAVVVTMDHAAAAERVVAAVRAERPDVPLLVRSRDALHAARLYKLGAGTVVPETLEASLDLARATLVVLGDDPDRADAAVADVRRRMNEALRAGNAT